MSHLLAGHVLTMPTLEYRWASEVGAHSMPHPQELAYLGYTYLFRGGEQVRDPRYPHSVLMVRAA